MAESTVRLHRVSVERFNPGDMKYLATMKIWEFDNPEGSGWMWNEISDKFTPPENYDTIRGLSMVGVDDNCFGFWSTKNGIFLRDNVLFRCTLHLSSDVSDQSLVPGLRLRLNTDNFQSGYSMEIYSAESGECSPVKKASPYILYFLPPQGMVGGGEESLHLSFDMKSFDKNDEIFGSLILEKATVELISLPE
jgi:hypothetical protein